MAVDVGGDERAMRYDAQPARADVVERSGDERGADAAASADEATSVCTSTTSPGSVR
jgi:hypothetical protein